jgi:hypothetical protein
MHDFNNRAAAVWKRGKTELNEACTFNKLESPSNQVCRKALVALTFWELTIAKSKLYNIVHY